MKYNPLSALKEYVGMNLLRLGVAAMLYTGCTKDALDDVYPIDSKPGEKVVVIFSKEKVAEMSETVGLDLRDPANMRYLKNLALRHAQGEIRQIPFYGFYEEATILDPREQILWAQENDIGKVETGHVISDMDSIDVYVVGGGDFDTIPKILMSYGEGEINYLFQRMHASSGGIELKSGGIPRSATVDLEAQKEWFTDFSLTYPGESNAEAVFMSTHTAGDGSGLKSAESTDTYLDADDVMGLKEKYPDIGSRFAEDAVVIGSNCYAALGFEEESNTISEAMAELYGRDFVGARTDVLHAFYGIPEVDEVIHYGNFVDVTRGRVNDMIELNRDSREASTKSGYVFRYVLENGSKGTSTSASDRYTYSMSGLSIGGKTCDVELEAVNPREIQEKRYSLPPVNISGRCNCDDGSSPVFSYRLFHDDIPDNPSITRQFNKPDSLFGAKALEAVHGELVGQ